MSKELMRMNSDEAKDEIKSRWDKLIEDLQRERDEIRVRLNLARKEADAELDKLDARIEDFKARSKDARGVADSALDDIEAAAKKLWEEIREGFDRVRKTYTDKA
jgi:chromosome segregation ATPase